MVPLTTTEVAVIDRMIGIAAMRWNECVMEGLLAFSGWDLANGESMVYFVRLGGGSRGHPFGLG